MYVCLCNNVTDRAIRHAAKRGAGSLEELREELGVASRCGRCACVAQEILHEQLGNNPADNNFALPYAVA